MNNEQIFQLALGLVEVHAAVVVAAEVEIDIP
jgi:hypothetical protein